jgi:hypothetical protein
MKKEQIEPVALDTLESVAAIAAWLGKTERQVNWLIEKQQIPVFRLNGVWHLRKSTYLAFIARLEAAAMPKTPSREFAPVAA